MSSEKIVKEVIKLPSNIECGMSYVIKQSNPNNFTHGMFKYPCKFIPEIPRWAIEKYASKNTIVFDPFSGSGTTLLEANINGYDAVGTEIDDVAKKITSVKTKRFSEEEMQLISEYHNKINKSIKNEKVNGYVPHIDNIEHWFSPKSIKQLGRIKKCIDEIEYKDIKDFFEVVFVSIIKRVSYADDASPKPYVSTKIKKEPPTVIEEYGKTYLRYYKMVEDLSSVQHLGNSTLIEGDALNFKIPKKTDLVITSPPYINAFDYGRTMRLENLWLGLLTENDLRNKKANYIGTEKINKEKEEENLSILSDSDLLKYYYDCIILNDKKRALVVKKFFDDMKQNMISVYNILEKNGKYVIVIGNSNIRKTEVESWRVLKEIGEKIGFKTVEYFNYIIQNPYIRIPRKGRGGKISRDYVLVLEK